MSDEQNNETQPDLTDDGMAELGQLAEDMVRDLSLGDGTNEPATPRDERGRFVPRETAQDTTQPEPDEAPAIEPGLVAWAKDQGVSESDLAMAKSDRDVQSLVAMQRSRALSAMGTSPQELQAALDLYRRQNGAPEQPKNDAQQAQTQSLLEQLNIELDEDEWSPTQKKVLESLVGYVNKVAETVGPKLSKVEEWTAKQQQEAEQRAELQRQHQEQQSALDALSRMGRKVPGFVERFGDPGELDRLSRTNPDDPKVRRWLGMQVGYLEPAYQKRAAMFGPGEQALEWAIRDVMQEFGQETTAPATNGRPMSHSSGRAPRSDTPPNPENVDVDGLYNEVFKAVSEEWDRANGNPYARMV